MCHGGTDNQTGAPPRTTWGQGADPVRVGAHTSHLSGSSIAPAFDCGVCHVKPADALAAGHIDQSTASVTFEIGGRLREPDLPLLRALIDAVPLRVSLVTPSHRYLYANREFLDFVGRSLEGLVGRTAREVLGDEVYEAFAATAARVSQGESPRWEGWIRFARGGSRYLQVAMSPYAPGGGELQAIFVSAIPRSPVNW